MSSIICKICEQEIHEDNLKHWWKEHGIKMADYFCKYYNKKDLLTNEAIPFKNPESYLLSDFCNKHNLNKWFKSQPLHKQTEYLKSILIKRRELKSLEYIPTQFEQRSIEGGVGIATYNKVFKEGYYKLCESIGYKSRGFENIDKRGLIGPSRSLRGNPILIDSREQSYLSFGSKNIEISTLEVGDYTIKKNNYGIYIERKELGDLINTMSQGYERFTKELERAVEKNYYVILLCESPINDFLSFNYLPWLSRKIQATPIFISHRIRELLQKFPFNFQVGFCDGRTEMKEIILRIFERKDGWKSADIQLAIDLGLFEDEFNTVL